MRHGRCVVSQDDLKLIGVGDKYCHGNGEICLPRIIDGVASFVISDHLFGGIYLIFLVYDRKLLALFGIGGLEAVVDCKRLYI